MNKIEQQIKTIYTHAGDELRDLVELYIEIENMMRGNAEFAEKLAYYQKVNISGSACSDIEKKTNEELDKVCDSKTRREILANNKDINDAYEYYLWQKEEVDYMYPHAQSALGVFARDIKERESEEEVELVK